MACDGCAKVAFHRGQWKWQPDASIKKRQFSAYIGVTETFLVCNELVFIFQNEKRNQGCFLDNPDATSHVSQALDAKTVWLIYVFS